MSAEPESAPARLIVADIARAWWAEWKATLAALLERYLPQDKRELVIAHGGRGLAPVWRDGETQRMLDSSDSPTALARTIQSANLPVRREAVLQLAPQDVLRTALRLPAARKAVLLRALRFEVERVSPIPGDEVYFDFQVAGRNRAEKTLELDVRIVRRRIVDALKAQCRDAGLAVCAIRFADGSAAGAGTFPIDATAALKARWRRSHLRLFAAAIPVLTAAVLLAFYLRGEQVLDSLDDQISNDSIAAAHVEQLRGRIERTTQQLQFLAEQKQAPPFVAVLADISRTLPDGSWLTELEMTGNKIRIEGYSHAASDLIAAFDRSGRFVDIQFAAPVTQGPAPGIERFDLSFELAGRRK